LKRKEIEKLGTIFTVFPEIKTPHRGRTGRLDYSLTIVGPLKGPKKDQRALEILTVPFLILIVTGLLMVEMFM
jgi:hypothetical protein